MYGVEGSGKEFTAVHCRLEQQENSEVAARERQIKLATKTEVLATVFKSMLVQEQLKGVNAVWLKSS